MMGKIEYLLRVFTPRHSILLLIFLTLTIQSCIDNKPNAKSSRLELRFAVASDGHFGQPDADYDADYDRLISNLNREYSESGLDFVVLNGDIFHNNRQYIPMVKKKLRKLKMPWYVVRGNHDMIDDPEWENAWGYPDNFDFETGEYAFIFASTSDVKGKYLCVDDEWLWEKLDKYQFKKGVFIFMHISPRKWTGAGINCPKVVNCIESHPNVLAVFSGHDHNEDGLKVWNNVPYYFDGHFGGNWGVGYKGFRLVEVTRFGLMHTWQYNMEVTPVVNENVQHMAFLRKGKLDSLPSDKFNPGLLALTDGTFGSLNYEDGKWLGWEGDDFVWKLDMGMISEVNEIAISFLSNPAMGIFLPDQLDFNISMDEEKFENVFSAGSEKMEGPPVVKRSTFSTKLNNKPCKYIKIVAKNKGICPEWHKMAGQKALMFVDEIIVN